MTEINDIVEIEQLDQNIEQQDNALQLPQQARHALVTLLK